MIETLRGRIVELVRDADRETGLNRDAGETIGRLGWEIEQLARASDLLAPGGDELPARLAATGKLARPPFNAVTGLEADLGSPYTIDTIRGLKARFPGVKFVWIMGADSLAGFHGWRGWTQIMREVPVAVISRPWAALKARTSPAAKRFARYRRPAREGPLLATMTAPAWVYLRGPFNFASSTALRERQQRLAPR